LKNTNKIKALEEENKRLRKLLKLHNQYELNAKEIEITDLIDIDQLQTLFEKFSKLTGYTTGFIKQNTREVLISSGWTNICKEFHRGTKSSEYICMESNKELTKSLEELKQISLHECQHGMVDGATPIIIDGQHLADLFSGQVLFDKPNIENFKLGANKYGYNMDKYLKEVENIKILSKDKLTEVLEFLSFIANLIAQLGKEKKEYIKLNTILEDKVKEKTKAQDILLSLFNKGDSILFKWNNDENWSVDYVSPSVYNILEYSIEDFLNGNIQYIQCIHPDDLKQVKNEVITASQSNNEFFKHEPYRVITKNNQIKWVSDYTIIIRDKNNNIINYLGYINDITEEKQKEKLLYEQAKLASMGEMISNIAHQWRQPLSAISTLSTGMQVQKEYGLLTDELFEKSCQSINTHTQFLSKTIDNFKNFINGNTEQTTFNINNTINNFVQLIEASLEDYKINIILDLKENIDINSYENELTQCLINIYNNAKDILIKNSISKKIVLLHTSINNNNLIINITDNAGGIPDEITPKIFEPYFTTKHQSQGTGLGLHMSYNLIVDLIKGSIAVKNKTFIHNNIEYTGAQFTISIPLT